MHPCTPRPRRTAPRPRAAASRAQHLGLLLTLTACALPMSAAEVPLPCPVTGTLTIADDDTHVNTGTCEVQSGGRLQIDYSGVDFAGVWNSGSLAVLAGGAIVNDSGLYNTAGTLTVAGNLTNNLAFTNWAQLTVQAGGELRNNGYLLNNGGTLTLETGATLRNGRDASLAIYGPPFNVPTGASLINDGQIANFDANAVYNVQGQITGSGTWAGGGTLNLSAGGSVALTNTNTADANAAALRIHLDGTAGSASFQAGTGGLTRIDASGGVKLLGAGAAFTQLEDGTGTSLATSAGYLEVQGRSFTNQAGHTLAFTGDGQLRLDAATFHNNGTLRSDNLVLLRNGTEFHNTGSLEFSVPAFLPVTDASSSLFNTGSVRINIGASNLGTFVNAAGSSFDMSAGFLFNDGIFTLETGPASVIDGSLGNTGGVATINRELATGGGVAVLAGELRGTGDITVAQRPDFYMLVASGATLSPGDPLGTLTVHGDLDLLGFLDLQIGSLIDYDVLDHYDGSIAFGTDSLMRLDLSGFAGQQGGQSFSLVRTGEAFENLAELRYSMTGLGAGLGWGVREVALDGGRYGLQLDLTGVPMPAPVLLLLAGLPALAATAARRRAGRP